MKKLFFILLVAIPSGLWAQSLTISAIVRDRETSEPLGFASVGIKGQPVGTISNGQGEFDFHFPLEYRNEILVISMLGYKNFEAPVWTLLTNKTETILLDKSPIILEEIIVSDTLTGGDILGIALSRIEKNYPMQPFLLEAFYRDVKKVGGTYISLLEAAVKIYDENYEQPRNKNKLRERVRLIEVRKSLGYESKFTTYFDQANLLEDLLLENSVRYRHIEPSDDFFAAMNREKGSFYDGHDIYVVSHMDAYKLKVYVDKVDFSIVHFEYETTGASEEMKKRKNMVSRFMGSKKSIDFRRYNGKMYPSFITMTSKVNWYDIATGALKFETELFQQLLINKVIADPNERIGSTEKMRNYGLQYQDLPYNKEFWDNYNVIKETPLDKKIVADLEKVAPLQQQFEDN
ncbi:MAG: carboxypeptidase-like regulatory domain-containing protein [Bacteroidota bacterium]